MTAQTVPPSAWFVGAAFGSTNDQTARFLRDGIWEVSKPTERESAVVRSMKPGERIAIKATYVRRQGLPFDNRGHAVSVMAIKATGTIRRNLQDGERIEVDWEPSGPAREWYFFTYRQTIWQVSPDDWKTQGLLQFAFEDAPQDIERFCNAPFWRERFGTHTAEERRFVWTGFYEEVADKLLAFRSDRPTLVAGIQEIAATVDGIGHLDKDKYADGSTGFVRDICPFTTFGIFNRGLKDSNRKLIAKALADFLGVTAPVPQTFEGIPVLDNRNSWYFPYEEARDSDHIDALWDVFAAGLQLADHNDEAFREPFAEAFDNAIGRPGVGWSLTFGLYWVRPWAFLSLDGKSREFIGDTLRVPIHTSGPKKRASAADYLKLIDSLKSRFQEPSYSVHSFPELSLEAWLYEPPTSEPPEVEEAEQDVDEPLVVAEPAPSPGYGIDDILTDGCFLSRTEIERILGRLREKKNLILQGPPGTGKTWLAKRIAYALIGQKATSRVRSVQFHPNLSYEDFVRGWRPIAGGEGAGRLALADGIFMQAIQEAARSPDEKFAIVIEEINRGNPAQIFGELLTLLEAGMRTPSAALQLTYPDADGKPARVHIPENLYVIGTMNVADRSLAMVDFALRRRFAFVDLEPKVDAVWQDWTVKERGVDPKLAEEIARRIEDLNERISNDVRLGKHFRVGHSYVTPAEALEPGTTRDWFVQVVETELGPLLDEYWFDAPAASAAARSHLLQGW